MPLLLEFLGAIIRFALTGVGVWLVNKGVITSEQSGRFIDAATVGMALMVVSLAWSVLAKYRSRLKLLGALYGPFGGSEEEAKETAKDPMIKALAFRKV